MKLTENERLKIIKDRIDLIEQSTYSQISNLHHYEKLRQCSDELNSLCTELLNSRIVELEEQCLRQSLREKK